MHIMHFHVQGTKQKLELRAPPGSTSTSHGTMEVTAMRAEATPTFLDYIQVGEWTETACTYRIC